MPTWVIASQPSPIGLHRDLSEPVLAKRALQDPDRGDQVMPPRTPLGVVSGFAKPVLNVVGSPQELVDVFRHSLPSFIPTVPPLRSEDIGYEGDLARYLIFRARVGRRVSGLAEFGDQGGTKSGRWAPRRAVRRTRRARRLPSPSQRPASRPRTSPDPWTYFSRGE